jgi:hypothetical protein
MADYTQIGGKFGIIYTCNCGWLDRGHSHTGSSRPLVGTDNLWKSILTEDGMPDTLSKFPSFVVVYRQDAVKKVLGMKFYPGLTKLYSVRRGLDYAQKQQVALAIFQDVSLGFEGMQDSYLARKLTGTDSGFSEEDLVSDLIAFYKSVNPRLDVDALCKPVSVEASRAVWKASGPVGGNKNRTFKPRLHPCDECKGPSSFPRDFQTIKPAKKGELFTDWSPPPQMPPPYAF